MQFLGLNEAQRAALLRLHGEIDRGVLARRTAAAPRG